MLMACVLQIDTACAADTVQKSHYQPGNHHASLSKNVLFPGHNHLLTTGTDDTTF